VSHTFPPHEPGRHGWAELLTLVGAVRRLAFDRSLPPSESLCRIRDACRNYDRKGASSDSRTDPLNFSTSELELLELGLEIPFQRSRCNPHTLIVRCLEHGHAYTVLFQLR
jgi:hypothetical protein